MKGANTILDIDSKIFSRVSNFLQEKDLHVFDVSDMGYYSYVFFVNNLNKQKYAFKVLRNELYSNSWKIKAEFEIMKYINLNVRSINVPQVIEYNSRLNGILMEYIYLGNNGKSNDPIEIISQGLSCLHTIQPDKYIISTLNRSTCNSQYFLSLYKKVLSLDDELLHDGKVKYVKDRIIKLNQSFYKWLEKYNDIYNKHQLTIIHGDINDDNIIFDKHDRLVFMDWGNAKLAPFILEFAYMYIYSGWSLEKVSSTIDSYSYFRGIDIGNMYNEIEVALKLVKWQICIDTVLDTYYYGNDMIDDFGKDYAVKISEDL